MPKGLWASMGVVDTSTFQGHNFCIRSSFGALDTSSKRSSQGVHISFGLDYASAQFLGIVVPKKRCLRPQNGLGSSGPEKV
jgi:hypothetical protein